MMSTSHLKVGPWLKQAGVLLLTTWLAGCATPQPILSDDGLVVSNTTPNQVGQSNATGAVVRWGGTIAEISNLEDGKTAIELVSRPLHTGGRPIHDDSTEGRFIAETADFLDPEIIKVGRDLTLVGTVTGMREGKIGEAEYRFPVVAIENYHYWKKQTTSRSRYYPYGNGYSRYGYDPFYRDWPFRHNRHRRRSGASASFIFIQR